MLYALIVVTSVFVGWLIARYVAHKQIQKIREQYLQDMIRAEGLINHHKARAQRPNIQQNGRRVVH